MIDHINSSNKSTSIRPLAQGTRPDLTLPWWFSCQTGPVNADFSQRAVSLSTHADWRSTQLNGVDLRILEYIPGIKLRLTGQLRLDPASSPALLGENSDLEILMLRGELETQLGVHPAGLYIRLPASSEEATQERLILRCDHVQDRYEPAMLYFATGQMMSSDSELRRLDTVDESRWLPGPAEGTEVLPLHGHGAGNAMLIRWNATISFKPRLDPMGEEVLVLKGSIHDRHGHYPAGSWIRNPIAAWQSWSAKAGTVVYYKNGHFTTPAEHS